MEQNAEIRLSADGGEKKYPGWLVVGPDGAKALFGDETERFSIAARYDAVQIKRMGESPYSLCLERGKTTRFSLDTPHGKVSGECLTRKMTIKLTETSLFVSAKYTLSFDPAPRSIELTAVIRQ